MKDTTQTIFRSASRFFSGTMLSRITGMLRDMALAYAFGTQSAIAALLVAFRFAHLLRRLLGEGAMQTALVPHFEELRHDDPQRAGMFFRDLTASLTHILVLMIVGIMAILGAALEWGNLDSGNAEIVQLTLIMMPSLLFICLFGINASLLQCEKSYFAPSAAPIAFNLFWIVGIFFCIGLPPEQAMVRLSYFIILACGAQWAITLPKTLATMKRLGVHSLWKGKTLFSSDVRRLGKPLALGIVGVAAAQVNNALDAIFARWADAEGPAYLWYAIRLQQLPLALFGIALSGALLPPLSRAIKAGDIAQSHRFLNYASIRTVLMMLPITFALLLMGDGCINLVYGRGDFTGHSVAGTTLCLWAYALGLVPMALVLVLAPAFYARGDYKTPSKASVGSMALNVGLNTLLIGYFDLGAASVALATSASAWLNLFWLGIAIDRTWISRNLVAATGSALLATVTASVALVGADYLTWGDSSAFELLAGKTPAFTTSFYQQAARLAVQGVIFAGVLGLWISLKGKQEKLTAEQAKLTAEPLEQRLRREVL